MIKVLIDTDIGDDIDDAFAVALACLEKEIDLVAVTTVFKNTACRTRQVKQLLQSFGSNVPVYTGESTPYHGSVIPFAKDTGDFRTLVPCQYDDSMADYSSDGDAVEALVEYSYRYAGELVVVPVGPMTNIARAIQRDPNFAKNVKKIVTMGGWFTNPVAEWNILCDPEAASIVYSSGIPIYAVGLDVTLQCPLDAALLDRVRQCQKPHGALIARWLGRWFDYFGFEKSVLHDPLAVCSIVNAPCKFETRYCKVLLEPDRFGVIDVSDGPKAGYAPIYAATEVDSEEFYRIFRELYFSDIRLS